MSDFTDQNSVNRRLGVIWDLNDILVFQNKIPILNSWCEMSCGTFQVNWLSQLQVTGLPKTRNHWIFLKQFFFIFQVFFVFWWWFFLEEPSFDTARFQINIWGVSVIWGNHDLKVTRDPNGGTRDERETKGPILMNSIDTMLVNWWLVWRSCTAGYPGWLVYNVSESNMHNNAKNMNNMQKCTKNMHNMPKICTICKKYAQY